MERRAPAELSPFILASHDCYCSKAREWDLSGRRGSWSLWVVLDGRARWQRGSTTTLCAPQQAILRWRGIAGILHLPQGCRLRGVEFDVTPRRRKSGPGLYGWDPLSGQGGERQPAPQELFGQTPDHILEGPLAVRAERMLGRISIRWWRSDTEQLACNLQLAGWLAVLADHLAQAPDDPIEQAEHFAQQSLGSVCTVADMARAVHMPASTFTERYRAKRGFLPSVFLRTLRLEQAAAMLLEEGCTVASVCHRCGYPNAASFTRTFRAHFGMPPRRYREEQRRHQ